LNVHGFVIVQQSSINERTRTDWLTLLGNGPMELAGRASVYRRLVHIYTSTEFN